MSERRKYDAGFREGAVTIVRETGKPIAEGRIGSRRRRRHVGELGAQGPDGSRAGVQTRGGAARRRGRRVGWDEDG
jgi:hypothetical protein